MVNFWNPRIEIPNYAPEKVVEITIYVLLMVFIKVEIKGP